jgi:FAD/FMN-containing dehydrogenase/SAM-dependent methyltransferase
MSNSSIVNDVTRMNPVPVFAIATPTSVEEVQQAVMNTRLPLSVGGGHFSMGGQTASPGTLHLDLRRLNRVLGFWPVAKTIRVQAGIRWCDIQNFVDPHDLAVSIMQTYANFTVGGSLSVNVHGRYVGMGPLILSVRAITLVLANGERVEASPSNNSELFYAAIGGYGSIGIIVEAELGLADNCRVERTSKKMPLDQYATFFRDTVRNSSRTVFHNADLYPPHFRHLRAVTWSTTTRAATNNHRLQPHRKRYPIHRYFYWVMSETKSGKWRREYLLDPFVYLTNPVHWRNFEAGYDVAELEPPSRDKRSYILQEYFIPVAKLDEIVPKFAGILRRHRVNLLNISVRHAIGDSGSLLAWTRGETFALVLYHKQRTRENARHRVAVWTRELIDAVIDVGGTYYLPYQPHATREQFLRAYPRAQELFALKRRLDPEYRLRGALWDKYYTPAAPEAPVTSDFHSVYGDDRRSDAFYLFLQNIYRLYPEDRFHSLIKQAVARHADDEAIYRDLQEKLPAIKPALADITYALPSLFKQKAVIVGQTLELLGDGRRIDGYVEIGSTGRYAGVLRKRLVLGGPLVLVNDIAPSNSPADIFERGRLRKLGRFVPLNDYAPLPADAIPDASVDLVSCYIGLHHIPPEKLGAFMRSIWRVLRPGGRFILRDHDVKTPEMFRFVALVHTVFNAGLKTPWEVNRAELRYFVSIDEWVRRLQALGFVDEGKRLRQAHDPSDNLLLAFHKPRVAA